MGKRQTMLVGLGKIHSKGHLGTEDANSLQWSTRVSLKIPVNRSIGSGYIFSISPSKLKLFQTHHNRSIRRK